MLRSTGGCRGSVHWKSDLVRRTEYPRGTWTAGPARALERVSRSSQGQGDTLPIHGITCVMPRLSRVPLIFFLLPSKPKAPSQCGKALPYSPRLGRSLGVCLCYVWVLGWGRASNPSNFPLGWLCLDHRPSHLVFPLSHLPASLHSSPLPLPFSSLWKINTICDLLLSSFFALIHPLSFSEFWFCVWAHRLTVVLSPSCLCLVCALSLLHLHRYRTVPHRFRCHSPRLPNIIHPYNKTPTPTTAVNHQLRTTGSAHHTVPQRHPIVARRPRELFPHDKHDFGSSLFGFPLQANKSSTPLPSGEHRRRTPGFERFRTFAVGTTANTTLPASPAS
ncbi:hypothetical protein B0J13DRAFT_214877 [Dactylonectria estremocensis]|uniref:Uncharacterized protein n=1 Tax=Dactylonectria estremocensis TaxID=1079267 RepID=A0A9P9JEB6_9HYPO|nr:hypothetical protein B0J13DRAFT_214877 [Dactylonectria estremocensis]